MQQVFFWPRQKHYAKERVRSFSLRISCTQCWSSAIFLRILTSDGVLLLSMFEIEPLRLQPIFVATAYKCNSFDATHGVQPSGNDTSKPSRLSQLGAKDNTLVHQFLALRCSQPSSVIRSNCPKFCSFIYVWTKLCSVEKLLLLLDCIDSKSAIERDVAAVGQKAKRLHFAVPRIQQLAIRENCKNSPTIFGTIIIRLTNIAVRLR